MTDVGDKSLPQRRVVEASKDPRKNCTVHTTRLSTNHRYITSTKDKRYCFLCDTLYKPCTSPVQTLYKPCRKPVHLFGCSDHRPFFIEFGQPLSRTSLPACHSHPQPLPSTTKRFVSYRCFTLALLVLSKPASLSVLSHLFIFRFSLHADNTSLRISGYLAFLGSRGGPEVGAKWTTHVQPRFAAT